MSKTAPQSQAVLSETAATSSKPSRRIQARQSGVHGKGVFALVDIPAHDTIIEYRGEVITWEEALKRHPHDPSNPNHTFYFHVDDDFVIDGLHQGNSAKWINHACDPNCESEITESRVFIRALRDIQAGEELNYDYGLILPSRHTKKVKAEFACWCGSPECRGTMLASKKSPPKSKDKKGKDKKSQAKDNKKHKNKNKSKK